MSREHHSAESLDAEYLYPSDADVLEISNSEDGGSRIRLAVPGPETGQGIVLEATVDSVEKGEFELPLDDDRYD